MKGESMSSSNDSRVKGPPARDATGASTALVARHLSVHYTGRGGGAAAVNDLSLEIGAGEMVGIVGESGSGKTTLASSVLGLVDPTCLKGSVQVNGVEVAGASRGTLRQLRRTSVATILQDPVGALNPVRTIGSQLEESARAAGITTRTARKASVRTAVNDVGLDPEQVLGRLPHELSGGMNQRVTIAMALLKKPDLLVADEPTSGLDVRTQASVVALLRKVRADFGVAVMLITHDIGLAVQACDRIGVMYGGRLVEAGTTDHILTNAQHPYTRALLAATPSFSDRQRKVEPIPGHATVSRPEDKGCPFEPRCTRAIDVCSASFPEGEPTEIGHVWCWNPVPSIDSSAKASA